MSPAGGDRPSQLPRPTLRVPALIALLLLVMMAGVVVAGVAIARHFAIGDGPPIASARRVDGPLADGKAGKLEQQISTDHPGDGVAKAEAQAAVRYFDGWTIDRASVRIVSGGDDNAFTMGFTAHRPNGSVAAVRGFLWPEGYDGSGPWKLQQLWVAHGRHDGTMVFPTTPN